MFAKDCLKTIEHTINKTFRFKKYKDIVISIGWTDGRRGRLYQKLLIRDGYILVHEENEKLLNKYVRKNHTNILSTVS